MDGAAQGVLYFSLGTMVRSESLPPEVLRAFIAAFTQLPFRVLWKCNVDKMAALPSNILMRSWLPQKDILGNRSSWVKFTFGSGLSSFCCFCTTSGYSDENAEV
jgi:glucuronosyltransferase